MDIKINCKKGLDLTLCDMHTFQGDLKDLSDENYESLKSQIFDKGFIAPFSVWRKDGKYFLLDGHQRHKALSRMQEEGITLPDGYPTIEVIAESREKAKEIILALTSQYGQMTGKGLFDFMKDAKIEKLDKFRLPDINMPKFELEFFDKGKEEIDPREDSVPEIQPDPITKRGDIWLLGNHRVMCGDSTMIDDVETLMDGTQPDLIHTDPPYGMNAVSKSGVLSKNYGIDIIGDDNPDIAKDAFRLISGLYPEAKQIWWGANYYCSALPDSECWLVWDKNNGQSDQTDCELAWANFRSVVRQFTQASEKVNRVHPTQKPVSLTEWIITRFKITSSTIADFFGGSGSTLIAAEKHGIDGFIMEFDPKFVDVIIKRWQEYTGKEAILEPTGESYNSMCK